MNRKQSSKVIALRSLIAVLCIGFGILISAQFRSLPTRVSNPIAPYASLKETKEELYTEQDQLKSEIKNLQDLLRQAQKDNENNVLNNEEIRLLNAQKAQAGLTKLNGPGLIIQLDDSKTILSDESIVHAADIRDVINVLWASGAEGIAVNGQRIVNNTAIDCIVNTILINNVRVASPFQIESVGNQERMAYLVRTNPALSNLSNRAASQNLIFKTSKNNDITLAAFDGALTINTGSN